MKQYLKIFILIVLLGVALILPTQQNTVRAQSIGNVIGLAGSGVTNVVTSSVASSIGNNVYEVIQRWLSIIAYEALTVMAWITGMAGMILDMSIRYGTLDMKDNLPTGAINGAWTVLRDVGNLAFIFILLYIAIKTIFGTEGTDTKRLIRNVIIVGLLVNFSLFFTQTLIDISNVLSLTFYKLFITNTSGTASFSQNFTQPLGIPSLFDDAVFGAGQNPIRQIFIMSIGGCTFLLILTLTFLQAAILFMLRYIILIFAMVMSALAFLAFVLPSTRPWFDKWWNLLSNQLFFAPIYMLLIWLVMMITRTTNLLGRSLSNSNTNGNTLASALSAWSGSTSQQSAAALAPLASGASIQTNATVTIVNYLLIIGLTIAASVISMSVASKSGGLVTKTVGKINGAMFGVGGWLGRNTAGRAANALQTGNTGDSLRRTALTGNIASRFIARNALKGLENTGSATFDARNTKAVQTASKGLGGYQLGTGAQQGFKETITKQKEEMSKYVEKYGSASKETLSAIATAKADIVRLKLDLDKETDVVKKANIREELDKKNKDLKDANKQKTREIQEQRAGLMKKWGNASALNVLVPFKVRARREALAEFMLKTPTDKKESDDADLDSYKDELKQFEAAYKAINDRKAANDTSRLEQDKKDMNTIQTRVKKLITEKIKSEDVAKLHNDLLKSSLIIPYLAKEDLKKISEARKTEVYEEIKKQIATYTDDKGKPHRAIKELGNKNSEFYMSDDDQKEARRAAGVQTPTPAPVPANNTP